MADKKKKKPTVTIFIPAYNEEKNIKKIVKDSFGVSSILPDVLVIIDSKTTDNTIVEAKKAGARILKIKNSLGKGTNIAGAIQHIKGDYVLQIDADYQFIPNDIPKLIDPLLNGYDVTLGTRYEKGAKVEKDSVTPLKLFGSYFLSLVTSVAIMQRVTDVMAGFKAFKTPVLKELAPKTHHFGYEAELVIKAAKYGYKIKNVPITYKKRVVGNSNVQSLKHGFLVLQSIIGTRFEK
jgi:glycosyltransferase involved in cell wall biosynthesis